MISALVNLLQTINLICFLQSTAETSLCSLTGFLSFENWQQTALCFSLFTSAANQSDKVTKCVLQCTDQAQLFLSASVLTFYAMQCNQLTKLWNSAGKAQGHANFGLSVILATALNTNINESHESKLRYLFADVFFFLLRYFLKWSYFTYGLGMLTSETRLISYLMHFSM